MGQLRAITILRTVERPEYDYIEDRAVTDFKAFAVTAQTHIKRVNTPYAVNEMLEVLETLTKMLHEKRIVV